jgi:hypothetical protein
MQHDEITNVNEKTKFDDVSIEHINYQEMIFFAPSTTKLIVMSIFSLGLYYVYWFYKNWVVIKNAGKDCMPFWRSILQVIFTYSCFWYMREAMVKNGIRIEFPIGFLTIVYLVLGLLWRLPTPYDYLACLDFIPMVLANDIARAINNSKKKPTINNKFTKLNWVVIILGGFIIGCSIYFNI